MEQDKKMTIEEKIKYFRELNNITQHAFAEGIKKGLSTIIRTEKGERIYKDEEIKAAREYLGIETLPMLDNEIVGYKERIYVWADLIKNERLDEARKLRHELVNVNQIPYDTDLIMLYKMVDVRLFLKERSFDEARDNLEWARPLLADASGENQYHFYYSESLLHMYEKNLKEALQSCLSADKIKMEGFEKEASLYYNLAICYSDCGKYVLAIGLLERIYNEFSYDRTSVPRMILDSNLGLNYMRLGHIEQAREFFDKAYKRAEGMGHKTFMGFITHNQGCACWRLKEFKRAIGYFDKADESFEEGNRYYFENQYFKILCLINLSDSEGEKMLNQAISLAEAKDDKHYLMLFNSISHLITIEEKDSEKDSIEYIEKVVIPYLLDKYEYFRVFTYFDALAKVYTKKRSRMKYLENEKWASDVRKMMTGGKESIYEKQVL